MHVVLTFVSDALEQLSGALVRWLTGHGHRKKTEKMEANDQGGFFHGWGVGALRLPPNVALAATGCASVGLFSGVMQCHIPCHAWGKYVNKPSWKCS